MSFPIGVSKVEARSVLDLELGLSIISSSASLEEGTLIVPWSSRTARPVGVWRREGRGFGGV